MYGEFSSGGWKRGHERGIDGVSGEDFRSKKNPKLDDSSVKEK